MAQATFYLLSKEKDVAIYGEHLASIHRYNVAGTYTFANTTTTQKRAASQDLMYLLDGEQIYSAAERLAAMETDEWKVADEEEE